MSITADALLCLARLQAAFPFASHNSAIEWEVGDPIRREDTESIAIRLGTLIKVVLTRKGSEELFSVTLGDCHYEAIGDIEEVIVRIDQFGRSLTRNKPINITESIAPWSPTLEAYQSWLKSLAVGDRVIVQRLRWGSDSPHWSFRKAKVNHVEKRYIRVEYLGNDFESITLDCTTADRVRIIPEGNYDFPDQTTSSRGPIYDAEPLWWLPEPDDLPPEAELIWKGDDRCLVRCDRPPTPEAKRL